MENTVGGQLESREKNIADLQAQITQLKIANESLKVEIDTGLQTERDRKHAEDALKESEERFRNMFTAAAIGIATSTPQGKFLQVNAAYCQMLGYTEDELLSRNFASITHPDDLTLNLLLRDELLAGVRESFVMEKRYLKKNGEIVWTRHSISAVRSANGEIAMLIAVAENITERKQAEDQLMLKTAFWEAQVNSTFDGILVVDGNGMKILQNQKMIDLWNIPAEFADEADHQRRFAWIKSQIKNPEPFARKVAYLYAHPDEVSYDELELINGKIFDRYSASVKGKDGKYYGRIWVYHDITERKQIEARFRRLVSSNAQAVFLWNIKGGITDGNDAFLKLTRYTREDLEAGLINWAEMTPPEYAAIDRIALEALTITGVCEPYEKEWINKDGKRVPILLGAAMFEDNTAEGVCFVLDITERKRSEALLNLRDRAIQAVSQAILITDSSLPDNPIVYVSPSFEHMTGYSSKEAVGRNCRFIQGKDTNPEAVAQLREAIEKEQSCTVELLNYRKDGTPFWNSLTVSPVREPGGKLVNFIGVQTDVTQRRTLEEQLHQSQKMEAIGQLAGGVAHDFNNLLTVINGYSGLLLTSLPADEKAQRYLTVIKEAGEQSAALTNQLLAFSRNQFLSPKSIDLNEVVHKVKNMLGRIIGEDVQLTTVLQPELGMVMADPTQIEQILLNLSVNARDAMPQGGKLTIETHNIVFDSSYTRTHMNINPGHYVMLAVTDSGTGMTEEIKRHIFEPFFTTKGLGKGSGLGLAVIHGIVKQSEGSIEVYSEEGDGTCFKIYLPQVACSIPIDAPVTDSAEASTGSETILIVEDEGKVREFASHVLEECGYTILEAGSAKEALDISEKYEKPIHLLLTDVVMPDVGGRALAEQLKPLRPNMKVIFMSGYTEDAVVRHGILHEQVNFVQKPFSPLALTQKIREVLT